MSATKRTRRVDVRMEDIVTCGGGGTRGDGVFVSVQGFAFLTETVPTILGSSQWQQRTDLRRHKTSLHGFGESQTVVVCRLHEQTENARHPKRSSQMFWFWLFRHLRHERRRRVVGNIIFPAMGDVHL